MSLLGVNVLRVKFYCCEMFGIMWKGKKQILTNLEVKKTRKVCTINLNKMTFEKRENIIKNIF